MFEPKELISFLQDLSENNNTTWFDKNRERYKSIRKNVLEFATKIHIDMIQSDQELVHMNSKNALHHINRDVRFSRNKTPYKTYWGFRFSNNGRKKGIAGYSIIFNPEGDLYITGGQADLTTTQLNHIRDDIISEKSEFRKILGNSALQKEFIFREGNALKRCPSGYDITSSHIELLKQKDWYFFHEPIPFTTWNSWSEEELHTYIVEKVQILTPFVQMINSLCLGK